MIAVVTRVAGTRSVAGTIVTDTDTVASDGFPIFAGRTQTYVLVKHLKAEIAWLSAAGFTIELA